MTKIVSVKTIILLATIIAIVSIACRKSAPEANENTINFSLLSQYEWLITPKADTCAMKRQRNSNWFNDTVIVKDSTMLIYRPDSSFRLFRHATEQWLFGAAPATIDPSCSYMPRGGSDYSGIYRINAADSTITTIVTVLGLTLQPVTHKVLHLTSDSLKLYHPLEGIRSYYSN